MFRKCLHETGFADPSLAAEQDDLPSATQDPTPALLQQLDFGFAAHQWGQTGTADRFQPSACGALVEHPVDLDWLRNAFQSGGAQRLAGEQATEQLIS